MIVYFQLDLNWWNFCLNLLLSIIHFGDEKVSKCVRQSINFPSKRKIFVLLKSYQATSLWSVISLPLVSITCTPSIRKQVLDICKIKLERKKSQNSLFHIKGFANLSVFLKENFLIGSINSVLNDMWYNLFNYLKWNENRIY